MGNSFRALARTFARALAPYLPVPAAVLVVVRGWWNQYLLCGHDVLHTLQRQVVLDDAIRHGDWWPRFAEAFYFGYGSPLFHFYSPLAHYLTAPFLLLGVPVAASLKIGFALGLLLSGAFMALLARDLFGPWAAAAAGPLYVMAPYHLVDVFFRNAYAEALAFAWLPLALWGVLGAVRDGNRGRMLAGAAGVALLFLTHNITALIGVPVVAAWGLLLAVRHRRRGIRGPILGAAAIAGGVLVASFFWAPALIEKGAVQSHASLATGYFDYHRHFVHVSEFFAPKWHDGKSGRKVLAENLPFQVGLAHWALVAASAGVFALRKRWRADLAFAWAVLAGALVMCHGVSRPVWDAIPVLEFLQFPWRFLVLAALGSTIAAAAAAQVVAEWPGRRVPGIAGALFVVASPLFVYGPPLYPRFALSDDVSFGKQCFNKYEFKRHMNEESRFRPETTMTIGWIRDHVVHATRGDDFLPIAVTQEPSAPPRGIASAYGGEVISSAEVGIRRYAVRVRMAVPGHVALNRFYFPGWSATVDGREAATGPLGPLAVAAVPVGAGEHEVEFRFGTTPARRAAGWASLAGVALLGTAVAVAGRSRSRGDGAPA